MKSRGRAWGGRCGRGERRSSDDPESLVLSGGCREYPKGYHVHHEPGAEDSRSRWNDAAGAGPGHDTSQPAIAAYEAEGKGRHYAHCSNWRRRRVWRCPSSSSRAAWPRLNRPGCRGDDSDTCVPSAPPEPTGCGRAAPRTPRGSHRPRGRPTAPRRHRPGDSCPASRRILTSDPSAHWVGDPARGQAMLVRAHRAASHRAAPVPTGTSRRTAALDGGNCPPVRAPARGRPARHRTPGDVRR